MAYLKRGSPPSASRYGLWIEVEMAANTDTKRLLEPALIPLVLDEDRPF